jgi:hypothetical protein
MSDDPRKILKSVVETLYRQSYVLGAMTNGFNDLVVMCLSNLPKCNHEGCENPTTFKKTTKVSAHFICDRHLAEGIVNKIEIQEDWVEVENVEHIRSLDEYVNTRKNASEMTVH